jgi:hypothetical protein
MRATRLNFVEILPRARGWRLALLLAGLLGLALAGIDWLSQSEANAAIEARLRQMRPRISPSAPLPAARQRELQEQARAVRIAVRQLNMPISELIRSLQPPQDVRVAVLGFDVGGPHGGADSEGAASGTLKISAEARTPQEMTTYVAFLADQHLFKSVYLIKHELNATSPEKPYRFLLEAQWQE